MAPYVAQFVPVKLDVASSEYQGFRRQHEVEGNSIPKVFIVRADGETMFAKSTSLQGDEMGQVLGACLSNCGVIFGELELTALGEVATGLKEMKEAEDLDGVVRLLKKVSRIGTPGALGSFAENAVAVDSIVNEITAEAVALLKPVAMQLGMETEEEPSTQPERPDNFVEEPGTEPGTEPVTETPRVNLAETESEKINALVTFVNVTNRYDGLESIKDAVSMMTRHINRDDELKPLFRTVKVLEKAAEAKSMNAISTSLKSLARALENHPEGAMHDMVMETGRRLQQEFERLEAEKAAERNTGGNPSAGSGGSGSGSSGSGRR